MRLWWTLPLVASLLPLVRAHGRLIEPPSRASAWRYGFDTPHNYNDHELYCGGFTRQWVKNGGKCGVCGDPYDSKIPRAHEFGGTYGQGVIVRKYAMGATVNIRVELTASHFGYFVFSLCPDYKKTTQKCLDRNVLRLAKPQQEGVEHEGVRYFPKDGNKVYEMKYRLPRERCEHCVLQWRYIAGNNWGTCPNGTGAVGCGPQEEFRACADVTISGRGDEMTPPGDDEEIVPTSTGASPPGVVEETQYSPITALIVSLASFLAVFLVFSLLYIHFYQVGRQVKMWLNKRDKTNGNINDNKIKVATLQPPIGGGEGKFYYPPQAPMPPPRTRGRSATRGKFDRDSLDGFSIAHESVA